MSNTQTISTKISRNSSIDLFRYICAIMVVAIHTSPFSDVSNSLGFIFTTLLPRIAVPFFFAVSGYFYIQKLEQGKPAFLKYISRVLLVYFLWSIIYYIIDFIQWGHSNIKGYLFSCVYQFIISGSHYQFWFFPALIYSICIITILYKLNIKRAIIPISLLLYAIGCLGCAYYNLCIHIPVLGSLYQSAYFELIRRIFMMGVPFFSMGYLIQKFQSKFKKYTLSRQTKLLLLVIIIWLLEILLVIKFNFEDSIVLTFGLYPLVLMVLMILLHHPGNQYKSLSIVSRVAANFTFYAHPIFLTLLDWLAIKLTGSSLTPTLSFLFAVFLTLIVSLLIKKINNKYVNILVN